MLTLDNKTIIEDAGLIADALVVTVAGAKDPHWDESAKNFIEGLILHVATDPRHEGARTLITVRDLIKHALTRVPFVGTKTMMMTTRAALRHQGADARKRQAAAAGPIDRRHRRGD